ncbi:hypothetical protein [Streptomyces sp. PRh5]|uniref:hypothetical protein n=1 Tax=Streptomyces sp. PRh5 TaxID=1158056 RepID=UPI0018E331E6|nr:hypothetical protein [Streptomyces sp. PRh5]
MSPVPGGVRRGESRWRVSDYVMGNFRPPTAEETSPEAVVRALALAFLEMMREHPSIVRLFATRVSTGPRSMRGAPRRRFR